jgi:hypothetical protein
MLATDGWTNSFACYIAGAGLFVTVNGGVVVNNGQEVLVQQTVLALAASATNYIYFNVTSNVLQVNQTGFPMNVIPISTVITSFNFVSAIVDNRPDWVILTTPVGLVTAPGTELTSGNFSFSGWGTGASLTVNSGTQTGFSITITAGTNPSPQPAVTLTFNTGYANPPISIAKMIGGTGIFADILASNTTSQSVLTYGGVPQPAKTYVLNVFVLGQ